MRARSGKGAPGAATFTVAALLAAALIPSLLSGCADGASTTQDPPPASACGAAVAEHAD